MATKEQIRANRLNAKKSSGPRSAEGKARVARNAVTHGFTAQQLCLKNEEAGAFRELVENLESDFEPVGALERHCVERMAVEIWRLRRVGIFEAEMLEHELESKSLFPLPGSSLNRMGRAFSYLNAQNLPAVLCRYETSIERALFRNMEQLSRLQRRRGKKLPPEADAPAGMPDYETNPISG